MRFVPITEVCDFQGGTQPPKNEWSDKPLDGYIRMLQIRDFTQSERTPPEFVKNSKKLRTCNSDDVLIGRYGASIGKILTGYGGAYNVAIVKTIPNEELLNKKFLLCLLKSPSFQNFITTIGARAAQAGFNKSDLTQFSVPIIPIDDQIRIAHLLGKVEGLIAQRKQHLQQLDDLLKSVFLEMFGDPVRNEKGWDTKEITDVCDEIVDCVNKTAPQSEEPTPFVMVRTSNIRGGKISLENVKYVDEGTYRIWTRRSKPQVGDILFTREAPMGEAGLVDFENQIFLGQRIIQYRCNPNAVNPKFILALMKTRFFQRQIEKLGKGSTVKHLAVPDCLKFIVIAPPLPLQSQFSAIVEKIEGIKSRYQKNLTDLEALYGALSQQAFKGELDLSRVSLPVEVTTKDTESREVEGHEIHERHDTQMGVAV